MGPGAAGSGAERAKSTELVFSACDLPRLIDLAGGAAAAIDQPVIKSQRNETLH
jgi:hypothetical protein